jgi:MFS transporter, ACS family, solute carrier family 17 (sodium-dependent inorganic phosphate cotransporter), member 9
MTLGTCVLYASRLSVPLVIPVMAAEQQWTKTESGMVLSSFFWGYTLTQVTFGPETFFLNFFELSMEFR